MSDLAQTSVDPAAALLVFSALVAASLLLFWPRLGLLWRLRRARGSSERVHIEDALKHLYVVEYQGRSVSMESLAGAMEVSRGAAARTLQRLAERGLASMKDERPVLTEEGREYAVRVLRSHRLWERYLADRTGVRADLWHERAEEAEHALSPHQADELSARLGHPRYDPHGDPIPTLSGELPPPRGVPLSTIAAGTAVEVTHLEDEPPELFERIDALGLSPHMRFRVEGRDAERVRIVLDGDALALPSVVAANVTVRPLEADEAVSGPSGTLADLEPGQSGRVRGLSPRCQGPQRRRLLDLGVVPGTEIEAELRSAGGDPVAFRIRGALIALRREQASWVQIEAIDQPLAVAAAGAQSEEA